MLRRTRFRLLTIVSALTMLVPLFANCGKSHSAEVFLKELCCDKTTELGADETYILVYGRRSDGATFAHRWPGPFPNESQGHWDMNDNPDLGKDKSDGDSHCITNKSLFVGELPSGQSWDVIVLISEEDGGNTKDIQEMVGELAQKVPNPFVAGAGEVLSALTSLGIDLKDSDDFIGSFSVHIANNGGKISADWRAGERVVGDVGPDPHDPKAKEIRMNGDGSNYIGWFTIR